MDSITPESCPNLSMLKNICFVQVCFSAWTEQNFKAAHIPNSNFNSKFSVEHMYNYLCWDCAGKWPLSRWFCYFGSLRRRSWWSHEGQKKKKNRKMLNSEMSCWNSIAFFLLFLIFFHFCNVCLILNSIKSLIIETRVYWNVKIFYSQPLQPCGLCNLFINTYKCTVGICICFAFVLYLL